MYYKDWLVIKGQTKRVRGDIIREIITDLVISDVVVASSDLLERKNSEYLSLLHPI